MSDEKQVDAEQPLREALKKRAESDRDGQAVREAGERFVQQEEQALRRLLLPNKPTQQSEAGEGKSASGMLVPRRSRSESAHGYSHAEN